MVDLISQERKRHEIKLRKISQDNKRYVRKNVLSIIAALGVGTGNYLLKKHLDCDNFETSEAHKIENSIFGFLGTYLLLHVLSESKFIKNPLVSILNPSWWSKSFNFVYKMFFSKKGVSKDEEKELMISSRENPQRYFERELGEIYICFTDGNIDGALKRSHDLNELVKDRTIKISLVDRLVEKVYLPWAVKKNLSMDNRTTYQSITDASYMIVRGHNRLAEKIYKSAVRKCSSGSQRLDVLCLYGEFLERTGRLKESQIAFRHAVDHIGEIGDRFREIPGSKNKVYAHNSEFLGSMFIFKTGLDVDALKDEYRRTKFVQDFMDSSRGLFVKPIALVERDGQIYVITKRSGNFSLRGYIEEGHFSEAYGLMGKSLDGILLLHLKSNGDQERVRDIFGNENYLSFLSEKFLNRYEGLRVGGKVYAHVLRGLEFLCGEMDDVWRALVHKDFHPGNIIVNKKGEICVIDLEKAKLSCPYFDAVTLIEDFSTREVFDERQKLEELIKRYNENVVDGEVVGSFDESMKNYHLAGVFGHLYVFGSAQRFAKDARLVAIRGHHAEKANSHLSALEEIYSGRSKEKWRDLRHSLEDSLNQAQTI